jgi:hypothetical protein
VAPHTPGHDRLLKAPQVAEKLGVSERWVRDHTTRRSPKIRAVSPASNPLPPLTRYGGIDRKYWTVRAEPFRLFSFGQRTRNAPSGWFDCKGKLNNLEEPMASDAFLSGRRPKHRKFGSLIRYGRMNLTIG